MTNLAQNPALNKPVVIGSFVRFYDCQTANAERIIQEQTLNTIQLEK